MAIVQSTFKTRPDVARAGQLGDARDFTIESWIAEGEVGIGLAVVQHADEDKCQVGIGTSATGNVSTSFIGVSLRDASMDDTESPSVYQDGEEVEVLVEGTVMVPVASAVRQGNRVTFKATGALSDDAPGAGDKLIPGAVWASTTTGAGFAMLKLANYRAGGSV